jgi:Ser/Thr protein kinase RdoA (MazF antagonist)
MKATAGFATRNPFSKEEENTIDPFQRFLQLFHPR